MERNKAQIAVLGCLVTAVLLASSCNPTPAEKLLTERLKQDSLAAVAAYEDSIKQHTVQIDSSVSAQVPIPEDPAVTDTVTSRLQQVIDVFTDTSLIN